MNGRKLARRSGRMSGIRPRRPHRVADAIGPRRVQNPRMIVHQQGRRRFERLPLLETRPEFRLLLHQPQFVRADDGVEMTGQSGFFHFQGQTVRMGVGHHNHSLAGDAHGVQKLQNVGMHGDQVRDFPLEGHDIQRQFPAPVIQAVPGQRALHRPGASRHLNAGSGERQTVALGVTRRDQFPPEVVVEP